VYKFISDINICLEMLSKNLKKTSFILLIPMPNAVKYVFFFVEGRWLLLIWTVTFEGEHCACFLLVFYILRTTLTIIFNVFISWCKNEEINDN